RFQHGWSKGAISTAITFYFLVAGFAGIIIGRKIDIYGPKPFLIAGSLVFSIGFFLLGYINQTWQLFIVFFFLAIGWTGTSLIPVNTLITNWFIQKRGSAMSVTMTGLSLGGVVLVPLISYLILSSGLKASIIFLGILYSFVIIPFTLFFIKAYPSDLKLFPDGGSGEISPSASPKDQRIYASQTQFWTRKQAMMTRAFWAIVIAFSLALCVQIAFLIHQISFLSQYMGKTGAATAVSLTSGASIIGRLFLGTVVDHFDKRHTAMLCFLGQSIAVITLAYSQNIIVLYLCTFAFGLSMGSMLMMMPLITGECFGMVSFGSVSGLIGLFSTSGAAFGPMIAGLIFDATQNYQLAFIIFASFGLLATVIIPLAKPPEHTIEKDA
ncbi:MFS transporter, partial [bacterium]|nr:MFS transporter [bacterium]